MKIPGFNAELSLGPTIGRYRGELFRADSAQAVFCLCKNSYHHRRSLGI